MVPYGVHLLYSRASEVGLGSTEEGFEGEKAGYGGSFQEKMLVDLAFLCWLVSFD